MCYLQQRPTVIVISVQKQQNITSQKSILQPSAPTETDTSGAPSSAQQSSLLGLYATTTSTDEAILQIEL